MSTWRRSISTGSTTVAPVSTSHGDRVDGGCRPGGHRFPLRRKESPPGRHRMSTPSTSDPPLSTLVVALSTSIVDLVEIVVPEQAKDFPETGKRCRHVDDGSRPPRHRLPLCRHRLSTGWDRISGRSMSTSTGWARLAARVGIDLDRVDNIVSRVDNPCRRVDIHHQSGRQACRPG